MSSVIGLDVKVGRDVEPAVARHGSKETKDWIHVITGVEGNRIGMLAPLVANGIGGIFFLEMAGIFEEKRSELDGCGIGEDGLVVTAANKDWEPAGVVEVRMGKDGEVKSLRIDGKRVPVSVGEIARALEKTAIDKKTFASRFDKILGTGNTTCCAEKSEFGHGEGILHKLGSKAIKNGSAGSARNCAFIVAERGWFGSAAGPPRPAVTAFSSVRLCPFQSSRGAVQ